VALIHSSNFIFGSASKISAGIVKMHGSLSKLAICLLRQIKTSMFARGILKKEKYGKNGK
jgi:hypothetical protein